MKCLGQPPASNSKRTLHHFLQWKWFIVALGVGSLLNLINQYDAMFANAVMHWPKFYLTYLVPYCVSSGTAWFNR